MHNIYSKHYLFDLIDWINPPTIIYHADKIPFFCEFFLASGFIS